jgi:type II secretory pathway pseudopilin PulG
LATGLHLWLPNLVTERMRETVKNKRQAGFSTLELLIVIAMSAIITAIAVPEYVKTAAYLRAAGDLREINGLTALAKMRAAADFTHARVFADLNGGTFQLEVWNKTGNGGAGCWFADLDPTSACLTYSSGRPSGPCIRSRKATPLGLEPSQLVRHRASQHRRRPPLASTTVTQVWALPPRASFSTREAFRSTKTTVR